VLTGIKHAVRVSGIFSMDLERAAFITSLSKFTTFDSLRDIKQKHIPFFYLCIWIALFGLSYWIVWFSYLLWFDLICLNYYYL
jgi:hypothetical protein